MTDTFDEIVAELEQPGALYAAVIAELQRGHGETTETIGRRAWAQLGLLQQSEAFPQLLECYAARILFEESYKACQAAADAMDKLDTCLEEFDVDIVADAIADRCGMPLGPDDVDVERGVAQRLLDEIAMLRRRVDQAPAPAPDAA